jgi:hypothetical protein
LALVRIHSCLSSIPHYFLAVVDGGYFYGSIHSVDETGISRKFRFKVAHYLRPTRALRAAVPWSKV